MFNLLSDLLFYTKFSNLLFEKHILWAHFLQESHCTQPSYGTLSEELELSHTSWNNY